MFQPTRLEVMDRFSAMTEHFRATEPFAGEPAQIAKGLQYVLAYAVYEFTFVRTVAAASAAVVAAGVPRTSLRRSLLTLYLDPELEGLRECSPTRNWSKRLQLFDVIDDPAVPIHREHVMPFDGSHFRKTQLRLAMDVFGIPEIPGEKERDLFRIDEVVEARNAIAHGRETAEAIGRSKSREDIESMTAQMQGACLWILESFEQHCSAAANFCR